MQPLEPFFHAGRLELEHALSISAGVKIVGRFVVYVDFLDIYVDAVALLYEGQAFFDDGQRPEAQEVHLEHSDFLDI